MTHEERAEKVLAELPCPSEEWSKGCHDLLAEQFREVEREAQREIQEVLGTERGRAALAVYHGMPLPEEMLALRDRLRELARAGDAMIPDVKESIQEAVTEEGRERLRALIAAWDAATKGISRD